MGWMMPHGKLSLSRDRDVLGNPDLAPEPIDFSLSGKLSTLY